MSHILFYSGSFDPPHIGHKAVMYDAMYKYPNADKKIYMPVNNPFKPKQSTYDIRVKWCKQFFKNTGWEIVEEPLLIYWKDIISFIRETYKVSRLTIVLGSDTYLDLNNFAEPEKFLPLIDDYIIYLRNENDLQSLNIDKSKCLVCNSPVITSSTLVRSYASLKRLDFLTDVLHYPKNLANEFIQVYSR
jgi:nicotinate-nucleotide adenylyltransferase